MSRPTTTRAELRRAIAMRLMMPFARRVANGYGDATGGTLTSLIDGNNLRQGATNFWAGQWLFIPTTGEVRYIIRSYTSTGTIELEYALAGVPTAGLDYEIHSIFSAHEIHEAINAAISSSYPAFYETTEDSSLVVLEKKTEYDISSISPNVGVVHEVAVERPTKRMFSQVRSTSYDGGFDLLSIYLDLGTDLSEVDSEWYLSVYDGPGEGSVYQITGLVNNTLKYVIVSDASDPGLTTDSKVVIWSAREQELDWYRTKAVHFNSKEWPSKLRFFAPIWDYRGSRIRIKYSTMPSKLTADSSTTVVPLEYVVAKAIALLAQSRIGDNRVDRQRFAIMQELYTKEAEDYKNKNFFRLPDTELWMEGRDYTGRGELDPLGDPLGWSR